ncbi:sugar transporter SWEET1 isoform X2 [Heterocephalus glaber]|uniref:Sugar transporter SWEET n=2 Tax=Heterocephalus glaber TaxID=10181 RepID=A0AAX6S8I7_HETGA|nr:sugar transporter SWEET1 isoform X2 [Heterocephalus glaber]
METGSVADSLLSGACVFFTLGMFSTGLSDLRHMQMTRSVDSVQFLPFLTTDVNNLGWLSYGVLKGDGTLIIVNTVGAVLQTLYIAAYLRYCPQKRMVLLQTATLLGVLFLGYGYFGVLMPNDEARLQQLGLFCSVFTISMYLSPLADLAKVIQTKSTHRLSFSLTIATLLSSASWSLYGFRLSDPYITPFYCRCPTFQESLPALSASGFSGSTPQSKTRTIGFCTPEAAHLTTGHLNANLIPKSSLLQLAGDQFHGAVGCGKETTLRLEGSMKELHSEDWVGPMR